MMIMIWCAEHGQPVEGDLRTVQVKGTDNSYALDTSEMWCQVGSNQKVDDNLQETCKDTWQTITTVDSH